MRALVYYKHWLGQGITDSSTAVAKRAQELFGNNVGIGLRNQTAFRDRLASNQSPNEMSRLSRGISGKI